MPNKQNEELLAAWIRMYTSVGSDRLPPDLSYNESLICHLLYQEHIRRPGRGMTASELCLQSHMLKSQMNRTLCSMEEKQLILRRRSETDLRKVFVTLNPACPLYQQQHEKILALVDSIASAFAPEEIGQILYLFHKIADTAENMLPSRDGIPAGDSPKISCNTKACIYSGAQEKGEQK